MTTALHRTLPETVRRTARTAPVPGFRAPSRCG